MHQHMSHTFNHIPFYFWMLLPESRCQFIHRFTNNLYLFYKCKKDKGIGFKCLEAV